MEYFLTTLLIGLVATGAMTTFLWAVNSFNLYNVDMVKALGSFYTRKETNATVPGLIFHFSAGIFFAFVYTFLFSVLPLPEQVSVYIFAIFGSLLGFVHGVVVSLFLVLMVSENHPLEKFRKVSLATAIFHFVAHVIYGLVVGSLYAAFLS
ncbi:MAG: hypothetical protein HYW48_00270 [Deltaproteobacteria bacterium]|nr:hypothetical protein [Deltaproteobacteria bacterium]